MFLNALTVDNAKHAFRSISTADWGPLLERNAKRTGAFLALIFAAGFALGSIIHQWNDEIAGFVVTLLGLKAVTDGVKTEPKPEPETAPAAAAIQTDATEQALSDRQELVIETLKGLKVAQLRRVARLMGQPRDFYRTARKADLLDELCYQASTLQLLDLEIVLARLTNA